ncbi:MAG: hypothetical protein ABL889_11650 [Terricaulis sp.]
MSGENKATIKAVAKQYTREMAFSTLIYVAVLLVSVFVVRRLDPPQWIAIVLALASAAPALFMMRAYMRRLHGLDEFQRRVELESLAVAAAVVAFGSFTLGFLQSFARFPQIDDALMWVFPALSFCWGVARMFVRRRYQ